MKYVNRYLTITFVSIISLLTSCTYDYEYPTEITYHIEDNGFHEMIIDTLEKYEASIVYYDREKYIYEYDRNGNELRHFKMDLLYRDTFKSASNASYIIIKVSMDAGEMGYICTEPINIKFGRNEIILNENTPVHVELNIPEDNLPTRYVLTEDETLDKVLLPVVQANGYSDYMTSFYVHEMNKDDVEIKEVNVKKAMLGELQITSDDTTYLIVEIALYKPNGMYIGSVDVDKLFPITAHKLLKIDLNSDIKVKSSCFADCEIITP